MRLKSLELVGFKSFADRTIIHFEEGITGVVGPNGCGKSNVVDAIRWVMGEQSAKHLRGSQMEDVIFNGSDKRPAVGMSTVYLTFDNSDGRAPAEYAAYSEITIGRRLYRSGESEYTINKTPCRHKDIIDLFLGTGVGTKAYSIVEQGRISQIVSAKPEERRFYIEEAAGISKFKSRKESALRKVEATKANLLRLTDIIAELDRQLGSLSRQAKKAERYQEYFSALKAIEVQVASYQWQAVNEACKQLVDEIAGLQGDEQVQLAGIERLELDIESGRLAIAELERQIADVQEQVYALQNTVRILETDLGYHKKESTELVEKLAETGAQLESLTLKCSDTEQNLASATESLRAAQANRAVSEAAVANAETELNQVVDGRAQVESAIAALQKERLDGVKNISQGKSQNESLLARRVLLEKQNQDLDIERIELERQIKDLQYRIHNSEKSLDGTRQMRLQITEEVTASASTLEAQKAERGRLESVVAELKGQWAGKKSRLESLIELQKNFEGFGEGVRTVLRSRQEGDDLLGTVSELISTRPEFETAVSAVLGERLQYVVVGSESAGKRAVDLLKTAANGRGSFIPRDVVTHPTCPLLEGDGVVARMVDVVSCRADLENISQYLFANVFIVADLPAAVQARARQGIACTIVTLDGDVMDADGVLTGGVGGDASQQFLARRREISELEAELLRLESNLQMEEAQLRKVDHRVESISSELARLSQDSHSEEIKIVHQEKDMAHLRQELERCQSDLGARQRELGAGHDEISRIAQEVEGITADLHRFEALSVELEQALLSYDADKTRLAASATECQERLTQHKMELATLAQGASHLESECQRLTQDLEEAHTEITRAEQTIANAKDRIVELERLQSEKQVELETTLRTLSEIQDRQRAITVSYQSAQDTIRGHETGLRELRGVLEQVRTSLHEKGLEEVRHSEKRASLEREILEKYHVDLATIPFDAATLAMPIDQAATEVQALKEKIEKLGSVNVDSIAEYAELQGRHVFLTQQCEDLNKSLDDLNKAIQKINRTSRERFRETFDAVNQNFQALYPRLFKGGKAKLTLTDEENILESGVEIFAQPPGKKLQSVTLLSGGEKALTAVAVIFAIFLTKPSPFCLLDEVDAPLDDVNVDRFNDMIRQMMGHSQFILITHNKRTMELADTLYGVTMQEPGVSRLVSVKLDGQEAAPADKTEAA